VTSPTGILEANVLYNESYETRVVERLETKVAALASANKR
jgi:hypothetical protein